MHDTHWTFRGALAGYNAIVEADNHPDWKIEPSAALGPMNLRKGGDLARMFGVGDAVSEHAEDLILPHGKKVLQSSDPFGEFVETSERAGPTILIIGRFLHGRLFAPVRLATCASRDLDEPLLLRLGLDRGGEIPSRRGLVDAKRALSGLRAGQEAEWLARKQRRIRPKNGLRPDSRIRSAPLGNAMTGRE